jgi:hypothetical protein
MALLSLHEQKVHFLSKMSDKSKHGVRSWV